MNRKEFTNLLLEWRKNFIHERGVNAIYHRSNPGEGYLINPSLREIEGLEDYMQSYIRDNSIYELNDVANLEEFGNGIVLPKNRKVIKMISDFFVEEKNNRAKSSEILSTAGNDECVIIHFTEGDFTLDSNSQSRKEKYRWTIHDLEHSLINMMISAEFYISDAVRQNSSLKDLFSSSNDSIYHILDSGTFSVGRYGHLVKKFFSEIDFTPEADLDDLDASAMAYCYIEMKDANDLDRVLEAKSLNDEEKQQLAKMFQQCYVITQNTFNSIKEKLKGCIVIVFSL